MHANAPMPQLYHMNDCLGLYAECNASIGVTMVLCYTLTCRSMTTHTTSLSLTPSDMGVYNYLYTLVVAQPTTTTTATAPHRVPWHRLHVFHTYCSFTCQSDGEECQARGAWAHQPRRCCCGDAPQSGVRAHAWHPPPPCACVPPRSSRAPSASSSPSPSACGQVARCGSPVRPKHNASSEGGALASMEAKRCACVRLVSRTQASVRAPQLRSSLY